MDWEIQTNALLHFSTSNLKTLQENICSFSRIVDCCLAGRTGCFCLSQSSGLLIHCHSCGIDYHKECAHFELLCPCCQIQLCYNPLGKNSLGKLQKQVVEMQRQDEFWELKRILEKLDTWLEYIRKMICRSPNQIWLRNSLRLLYSLPIVCSEANIIEEMLMNQSIKEEQCNKLNALASVAFDLLSKETTLKRKGSNPKSSEKSTKKSKIPLVPVDEFSFKNSNGTTTETSSNLSTLDTHGTNHTSHPPLMAATPVIGPYEGSYYNPYGYYPHYQGYEYYTQDYSSKVDESKEGYESQIQFNVFSQSDYPHQHSVTSLKSRQPDTGRYDPNDFDYYAYGHSLPQMYSPYDPGSHPYYSQYTWPQ
jgi:hypothetical protein